MSYRIPDEPLPSSLARLAVNPLWPLLAVMFGGAWLSWPWFAFNGFALGSPTRRRELLLAAGGFVGTATLAITLLVLVAEEVLNGAAISYAIISLTVWKAAISYVMYGVQARTFHLYEHYGGVVRNGLVVAVLGGLVGRKLVLGAFASALWKMLVA